MKIGGLLPTRKMQEKYKLFAESRSEIKLDPKKVPKELQKLIPYAEKWGVEDDIIRADYEKKSSAKEKKELKRNLAGQAKKINKWLDSFKGKQMTDEAAAFMYMLLAAEEMGIYPKTF
jgi:nitroreductase